jgi:hypothetical protein
MSEDVPERTRNECYERDGYRCRMCGITNGIYHLHHIAYRSEGGPHTHNNLITLCFRCHDRVHTDKGFYQPLLKELISIDRPVTGYQLMRWRKKAGFIVSDTM